LASELKSRGMRVFLSADTIDAAVGSTSWMKAIDEALIHSRAVLVLLTQHALASKWVEEEWRKYYRLMVDTESGVLFSLRLGGPPIADLPLTLRMYQCIDSGTGRIEPSHLTRILDIVRGL
jgi:TIR domain